MIFVYIYKQNAFECHLMRLLAIFDLNSIQKSY